jgi:hypothetical protein
MKSNIKISELPHGDIIVPNGDITIPSIFMFNGADDLYPFLYGCEKSNCKVRFENENIDILPDENSTDKTFRLLCYVTVMNCRKVGNDYIRYLSNLDKMQW